MVFLRFIFAKARVAVIAARTALVRMTSALLGPSDNSQCCEFISVGCGAAVNLSQAQDSMHTKDAQ
jgi:hypothetical protein